MIGLAADQVAKHFAIEFLTPGEPVRILGDVLIFQLVFNPGGAFSIGAGSTWIFTIALAGVAIAILVMSGRIRSRGWAITLGLLLAGVLGNLTDRLFREPGFPVGHVVDYISTPWLMPAIYNIADMFIVGSMITVALLVLRGINLDGSRHVTEKHTAETPADDETLLGAAGDEFPPNGGVAGGWNSQFPVADANEGIPVDELGLPPMEMFPEASDADAPSGSEPSNPENTEK